ncbi:MAG: glycoside hydrolase family 3 C-terminal domain-containing protein, partial [Victivallales bacterium]|nr:glycoside hydrolase family 3 C-terminal domain-containing protein [Victivallales bacterium]
HFAVHSGPEGCRHAFDARVSEKDLRETYLPAFKALVDAGVEAVMGAYNKTNGEVCCGSETLLVDILRGEWGFEGHVTSDCWAVRDFHEHHKVTSGPAESAALALKNGCDLNCGCAYESLLLALKTKLIEESDIDTSLRRVLRARFKLGMFDDENDVPFSKIPLDVVCSEKHLEIARDAAVKSVVLLKNKNNILPLRDERKILVTGPNALSVNAILGNYFGLSERLSTILEGIVGAVPEECTVTYNIGCLLDSPKTNVHDWAVFEAKENDVVIAVMGLDGTMEGEEGDAIRTTDGDRMSHSLPKPQLEYLQGLAEIDVPVILVLTGGSPIDVPADLVEAVLFVWYPGQEGGNAVADIIFGDKSPSGRLPITFPKSWDQLPPFEDYAMSGRTYKYMTEKPQYPFGFGMSYAKFEYSGLKLENDAISAGSDLNFEFKLTNSGDVDAEEVIQVYIGLQGGYPEQPLWKLVSFERKELKGGETTQIKASIAAEKLKSVNDDGTEGFLLGDYTVYAGGSSPGKRSLELGTSIVSASFAITL